jgi:hypothetical protein
MPMHGFLTGGSKLQKKRKEIIITAIVLMLAFVVMMAALAYNPIKGDEEPTSMTIYGTVIDEKGNKLENATIQAITTSFVDEEPKRFYTSTDASGNYSVTFEHGKEIGVYACVFSEGNVLYWSQHNEFYVQNDISSIRSDFVLYPTTNVSVPIGIVVVSDTIDGSTITNISVDLNYLYMLVEINGLNSSTGRVGLSFDKTAFNVSAMANTSAVLYMNATVQGEYDMAGQIAFIDLVQVGDIYSVPFNAAVLDEEWSSETHSVFDLSQGENRTITAIANGATCEFPSDLDLSFSFLVLGQNITVIERGITFTGEDSDISSITITIEPVTDGVHSYDECTINGCIVYIREILAA